MCADFTQENGILQDFSVMVAVLIRVYHNVLCKFILYLKS